MPAWDKNRPGGLPDPPVLSQAEREAMAILHKQTRKVIRQKLLLLLVVPATVAWAVGLGIGLALGWWLL